MRWPGQDHRVRDSSGGVAGPAEGPPIAGGLHADALPQWARELQDRFQLRAEYADAAELVEWMDCFDRQGPGGSLSPLPRITVCALSGPSASCLTKCGNRVVRWTRVSFANFRRACGCSGVWRNGGRG